MNDYAAPLHSCKYHRLRAPATKQLTQARIEIRSGAYARILTTGTHRAEMS
jgi:hypothetical protein